MAIVTPATVGITPVYEKMAPAMTTQPMLRALRNLNFLWKWFRPGHLSVAWTAPAELTSSRAYVAPILPSADGLRYSLEHRFVCSAGSESIDVTVDYTDSYAGGGTVWTTIYTQTVTSNATPGALTTHTKADQTIPATAVALRVTYSAPSLGNTRTDHHLLVWPTPADAAAGVQPSGAVPSDDTMLLHADGAPMHTEWLNRCKETPVALVRDRLQCGLSFAQSEASPQYTRTDETEWWAFPPGRMYLPLEAGKTVQVKVRTLATVSAGDTTELVRLRQVGVQGGKSVLVDASGLANPVDGLGAEVTLEVQPQGSGLMRYVDLELAYKTTSGNTTRVLAATAWPVERNWRGEDLDVELTGEATPPAAAALLASAVAWPEELALLPYVGCAHLFDAISTSTRYARYLAFMVAPAAVHARAALSRSWETSPAAAWYHEAWTNDGGTTGNDVVRVAGPVSFAGGFPPTPAFDGTTAEVVESADTIDDTPTTPQGRQFELQTLGYPYVEPAYVSRVAGVSFVVSEQLADLSTL